MKTFNVILTSKNKNAINNYFLLLSKYLIWSLYSTKKNFKNKINKKNFTILKSPHVNKKAQEHFETRFFKKCLIIKLQKIFKFIIFLKKSSNNMFSDVNIKCKQIFYSSNKLFLGTLNINNFKTKSQNNTFFVRNFKLKKRLNKVKINHKLKYINVRKNNKLFTAFILYSDFLNLC